MDLGEEIREEISKLGEEAVDTKGSDLVVLMGVLNFKMLSLVDQELQKIREELRDIREGDER